MPHAEQQSMYPDEETGGHNHAVSIGRVAVTSSSTILPDNHADTVTGVALPLLPTTEMRRDTTTRWLQQLPDDQAERITREDPRVVAVQPLADPIDSRDIPNIWAYPVHDLSQPSGTQAFLRSVVPALERKLNGLRLARDLRSLAVQAAYASVQAPVDLPAGEFGGYPLHLHIPDTNSLLYLPPGHTAADITIWNFGNYKPTEQRHAVLHHNVIRWLLQKPQQARVELLRLGARGEAEHVYPIVLVRDAQQLNRQGVDMHHLTANRAWANTILGAYVLPFPQAPAY